MTTTMTMMQLPSHSTETAMASVRTLTSTATVPGPTPAQFRVPYVPGRTVQMFRTKPPPLPPYERAVLAYKRKIAKCADLPPKNAPVYVVGGMAKVKLIFNDMRIFGVKKDGRIYAAAINTAIRLGEIDEAVRLLRTMVDEEHLAASPTIYAKLIDACKYNQNPDMAQSLFDELLRVYPNIFAEDQRLAVRTFTVLINAFSRVSDPRAIDAFNKMKEFGVKPNQVTYGALIKLFSRTREYNKAIEFVQQMKEDGLSPNREIFNMVLQSCNMPQDKQQAVELFENMKLQEGVLRDYRTYTAMIDKMACCADYDAAYKYYERMKQAKVKPRLHAYVLLLECCAAQQDLTRARGLLREARRWGLKPDTNEVIMSAVEKMVNLHKEKRAHRITQVKARRATRRESFRQSMQVQLETTQQNVAQILSHLADERAEHKKQREAENLREEQKTELKSRKPQQQQQEEEDEE